MVTLGQGRQHVNIGHRIWEFRESRRRCHMLMEQLVVYHVDQSGFLTGWRVRRDGLPVYIRGVEI